MTLFSANGTAIPKFQKAVLNTLQQAKVKGGGDGDGEAEIIVEEQVQG